MFNIPRFVFSDVGEKLTCLVIAIVVGVVVMKKNANAQVSNRSTPEQCLIQAEFSTLGWSGLFLFFVFCFVFFVLFFDF